MPMIIIGTRPHLTAFFIVSVEKAVQGLLQQKAALSVRLHTDAHAPDNLPQTSRLVRRHWQIIRSRICPAVTLQQT